MRKRSLLQAKVSPPGRARRASRRNWTGFIARHRPDRSNPAIVNDAGEMVGPDGIPKK